MSSDTTFNSTSSRYKTFCTTNHDPSNSTDTQRMDLGNHIPGHHNTMTSANDGDGSVESKLRCCCGRPDCAYLEHNNVAVDDIERKLERAAQLGQALLSRHESFVADSQQEHARLESKVAQLENERSSLQTANERVVAQNRELLARLERLNDSYKASDNTVKTLEGILRDTEIEIRRLNGLARRAEDLDLRVQEMEKERTDLMRQLTDGESESRTTLARWRESERKVRQLELDVQKIEWEAKMERDKHEEIVARLERERVLERELGGAEGRLKGAAALQGIETGKGGNVVSHFVRDILQDNANLQVGIVELRELLQTSNEEVQGLRQQILHHQPLGEEDEEDQFSTSVPLNQELGWNQPSPQPSPEQGQREVHVHHHYHAKVAKQNKTPTVKRASRRRVLMSPAPGSSPGASMPSTPTTRPQRYASSPIIPIQLNQPQPRRNRWSVQSTATMPSTVSSLPSSPRSYIFDQQSSIFDRLEIGEESSRPTSPESAAGYISPSSSKPHVDGFEVVVEDEDELHESDGKENKPPETEVAGLTPKIPKHDLTPRPWQIPNFAQPVDDPMNADAPPNPTFPIVEEDEEGAITPKVVMQVDVTDGNLPRSDAQSPIIPPEPDPSPKPIIQTEIRPSLHRSSSHDSLVSISGMDIHIARRPPTSSTRIRGNAAYFPVSPSSARSVSAAQPLASITDVSATSSKRSISSDYQGPAGRSLQSVAGLAVSPDQSSAGTGVAAGLGRMVGIGGWVSRKWGIAPMKSVSDLRYSNASIHSNLRTPPKPIQRPPLNSAGSGSGFGSLSRTPGINQSGAIPGFWLAQAAATPGVKVHAESIDEEGLREVFAE